MKRKFNRLVNQSKKTDLKRPFCNHQSQRSTSRVIKRYGGTPISDKHLHFLVHELKPLPGRHEIYLGYGNEVYNAGYRFSQKHMEHILKDNGYELGIGWLSAWYAGDPHSETAWRARVQAPLRFLLKNNQRGLEATTSTKGGARDA